MSRFSSNEQVSLEKTVCCKKIIEKNVENISEAYEIVRCAEWIRRNNFKRVCLQFPDHLSSDSIQVSVELQKILSQPVYILGDNVYESCCIDFIAAAHVDSDAIIHFGPVCFSKVPSETQFLNIYEKHEIDLEKFSNIMKQLEDDTNIAISLLIDTEYLHKIEGIRRQFSRFKMYELDQNFKLGNEKNLYIYIGTNFRKLEFIHYAIDKENVLFHYDPDHDNLGKFEDISTKVIKQRSFLIEKIKDSSTFGLIIGTLSVDNYMKILGRLKKILRTNKKKTYTLSVGKINEVKLANFPELDIYVVITCAFNKIYESREFFKPVVTPYDVEKAFNQNFDQKFTTNYNEIIDEIDFEKDLNPINTADVSLITGNLRYMQIDEQSGKDGQITLKSDSTLSILQKHTWKGLEQNLSLTQVKLAKKGRHGIAESYTNELE